MEDNTMTEVELKAHVLDDLIDYIGSANCLDSLPDDAVNIDESYNKIANELVKMLDSLKS